MVRARSCEVPSVSRRPSKIEASYLCHNAIVIDELNAAGLEILGEFAELLVSVKLRSEDETTRPCKNGSNTVRGCLASLMQGLVCSPVKDCCKELLYLLVLSVVAGDLLA